MGERGIFWESRIKLLKTGYRICEGVVDSWSIAHIVVETGGGV